MRSTATASQLGRDGRPVAGGATTFPTFHEAYLHHLWAVREHPAFENAPRGQRSRERIGVSFAIEDPRQRVVWTPARRLNLVFNYAEALWYLRGSDDLEEIAYYASRLRRYSSDGRSLTGTAYGPKMFGSGRFEVDQWEMVVRTLRDDPASKRAVLQIFSPDEYLVPDNIDVSCTMYLQFLRRGGRLYSIGSMRANDAFRGAVSDVFSFTLMQELLATQLGDKLGSYQHNVGSYHVYGLDDLAASAVISAEPVSACHGGFPAMPTRDNWPDVRCVLEFEALLRADEARLSPQDIADLKIDEYWQQVVALFELYRQLVRVGSLHADTLMFLRPAFRFFVVNRWPEAVPPTIG